ncbi:MAG TPA: hypothetical protein VGU67_07235 [Edaphobacter sp.]|nr:hypothetical protein [Edaphobacter sp.]
MNSTETAQSTKGLRNLYLTRAVVQFLWAVITIAIAPRNPALGATLLILYPLWDVACTLYDLNTSKDATSATLYANAAAGILTAIGIGLTAYSHPSYAVAIFGVWALLAGLLQFIVGILRRQRLGGQWAMILSGLQSTAAGVAFAIGGLKDKLHLKDLAGYAIFGAVYFLVGGLLIGRKR